MGQFAFWTNEVVLDADHLSQLGLKIGHNENELRNHYFHNLDLNRLLFHHLFMCYANLVLPIASDFSQ
jgi:hypothetical protein